MIIPVEEMDGGYRCEDDKGQFTVLLKINGLVQLKPGNRIERMTVDQLHVNPTGYECLRSTREHMRARFGERLGDDLYGIVERYL